MHEEEEEQRVKLASLSLFPQHSTSDTFSPLHLHYTLLHLSRERGEKKTKQILKNVKKQPI